MIFNPAECLIPAAGSSSRMHDWKPLLPFGNSTIIETVVCAALTVCSRVVLVTGFRADELAAVFSGNPRVEVIYNPGWQEGMLSSIFTGIRQLTARKFFIVPGDMPQLKSEVYRALLDAPAADVVYPVFKGKRGHPVLIDGGIIGRICELSLEKETLRDILRCFDYSVIEWHDSTILKDIDTPDEYNQSLSHM